MNRRFEFWPTKGVGFGLSVPCFGPVSSPRSGGNLGVVRLQNTQTAAARTAFRRAVWLDLNLVDGHVHRGRPASRVSQTNRGIRQVHRPGASETYR
jgi:hypothetical protein